ncbi:unnamed protein product, partial [Allacma fusca]
MKGYVEDSEGRSCMQNVVLESEYMNIPIALAEQLCNPAIAPHFRKLWNRLLNLDIFECLFASRQLQDECEVKKYEKNEFHARFQDLGTYFECMKPG